MPIYEYRCDSCARTFEMLTSFAQRQRATACPSCESVKTRVLVSAFARMGGDELAPTDFGSMAGAGGGCACGGSCSCGGGSAN